jgi:hypothetical protein
MKERRSMFICPRVSNRRASASNCVEFVWFEAIAKELLEVPD